MMSQEFIDNLLKRSDELRKELSLIDSLLMFYLPVSEEVNTKEKTNNEESEEKNKLRRGSIPGVPRGLYKTKINKFPQSIELLKPKEIEKPVKKLTVEDIPYYSNEPQDRNFLNYIKSNPKNIEQIMYFIKRENRFLFQMEITKMWIIHLKPNTLKKVNSWVYECTNREYKEKKYFPDLIKISYKKGIDNKYHKELIVYGLQEWLDENGNIKPQYKPKNLE